MSLQKAATKCAQYAELVRSGPPRLRENLLENATTSRGSHRESVSAPPLGQSRTAGRGRRRYLSSVSSLFRLFQLLLCFLGQCRQVDVGAEPLVSTMTPVPHRPARGSARTRFESVARGLIFVGRGAPWPQPDATVQKYEPFGIRFLFEIRTKFWPVFETKLPLPLRDRSFSPSVLDTELLPP